MKTNIKRIIGFTTGTAAIVAALFFVFTPQTATAAPVIGFNPGYIISDNIFTNSQTMTPGQIQDFLNSKLTTCDTNGTQKATEYGSNLTRAQYAASRGWSSPPFTCLKDFSENGISSAQIIYNAAQQYQINPQVLLVLLQKEQGLLTDTWPIASQYRSATGYGCPDTAPCDSQYYGLTNQVNWAAKMFHAVMIKSSTWYSPYTVGNNYIGYNPNSSCGGTTVNIQNLATAALYDYTPYQPNQAALNAGYGTGDSCGAYGNRNFYLYFSDWFGSPQFGNFVRSVDNATVYLVSGTNKYPIASMSILDALAPLGGITFVNQQYLDALTTGGLMGRVIRSNNGTVYFYDSGIKLSFGSCAQVEDYGSSCGQSILLQDGQISMLSNGPGMTNLYKTTSGKQFYIQGGSRREVFDNSSLTAAGLNGPSNTISESGISNLQTGTPVIRNNVVVTGRTSTQKYLYSSNTYFKLSSTQADYTYIKSLPSGTLDDTSIPTGLINTTFNGFVVSSSTGNEFLLLPQGKVQITEPARWGVSTVTMDNTILAGIPTATDPVNNGMIMTPGNGTVYYVTGGQKRPVPGWDNLIGLNITPFVINTIDSAAFNAIPTGGLIYAPGRMVKTIDSATVYVVKSNTELMPLSSFVYPQELGLSMTLDTMSSADFSKYTVTSPIQTQVICNGQKYVGVGGVLYSMSTSDIAKFGLNQANFVDAGTTLCNLMPKSSQALPDFLLDGTGTIYLIQSGTKRPFAGYGAYLANGGNPQNTKKVSTYFTSLVPTGATLTQ